MGKTTKPIEYWVRVEPQRLGQFGYGSVSDRLIEPDEAKRLEEYRKLCEQIAADVKRHADDVGSVTVQCETEEVCEHCGAEWTEGEMPHNGGCCEKDAEVCEEYEADERATAVPRRLVAIQRQVLEAEP